MVPNHVRYQTALHLEILFTILYYSKIQLFSSPFYLAGVEGLEPPAHGFGDRRSTNWATPLWRITFMDSNPRITSHELGTLTNWTKSLSWSRWRDSNPRPHGPKPCALPNCATPRFWMAEKEGFEPSHRLPSLIP